VQISIAIFSDFNGLRRLFRRTRLEPPVVPGPPRIGAALAERGWRGHRPRLQTHQQQV